MSALRMIILGRSLSQIGNGLRVLAVPLALYSKGFSADYFILFMLCQQVATTFSSLMSPVLVWKFQSRTLMVGLDLAGVFLTDGFRERGKWCGVLRKEAEGPHIESETIRGIFQPERQVALCREKVIT